jgi:hypothetical protein
VTATTRRRVIGCVVAIALTLPVEVILLQAISTPDSQQAVRDWVASLSESELADATGQIQSYPGLYRRELMRVLNPSQRSEIWRGHIQRYIDTRPDLSADVLPVLKAAIEIASPETFGNPSSDAREQTALVADQLTALLGRDEAEYLLYRLGPVDEQTASLEPIGLRLANYVRGWLVTSAETEDCDCASGFGCDGYGTHCRTSGITCNHDTNWPMCGWYWNEECDGLCYSGIEG